VIQHHLLRAKLQDAEACAAEILDLFFRGRAHLRRVLGQPLA
jgi:hypothetical protein